MDTDIRSRDRASFFGLDLHTSRNMDDLLVSEMEVTDTVQAMERTSKLLHEGRGLTEENRLWLKAAAYTLLTHIKNLES